MAAMKRTFHPRLENEEEPATPSVEGGRKPREQPTLQSVLTLCASRDWSAAATVTAYPCPSAYEATKARS